MPRSPKPRLLGVCALAVAVLAGCTGEDAPQVDTAEVAEGDVVETVAAPARVQPVSRIDLTAPLGGEVEELLVDDGEEVERGQPLVRLTSATLEQQLAQAEAALDAADALSGVPAGGDLGALGQLGGAGALGGGLDVAPLYGALAGQLEAATLPLLDALDEQAAAIEDDDARDATRQRLAEARASAEGSIGQLRAAERDARAEQEAAERSRQEAQAAAEEAQQRAETAQREAAAAQRRQAELALAAIEERGDDLLLVAPRSGTVELGRSGDGGGLAGLPGLGDLGGLAGGDLGGLGGLGDLGAVPGGAAPSGDGAPIAEGVEVAPGQVLVTLYDLSGFEVEAEVDEVDAVEVVEGQPATVLVDAFPDAELSGSVARVALSPVLGATGGATFPVEVRLRDVPRDLRLRVGLTASVEIAVREVDEATTVPTSALLRRGGQEVVFVVVDGRVREVPVEVEAIGDVDAAVRGPLDVGDTVATSGIEDLSDGDEVVT